MTAAHAPWLRHEDGVTTVDAEYIRPGFASVHVLQRDGRAAVADAGTNASVPLIMRALGALGVGVDTVDWLFLTHVHLDHAGGAGALLQQLPRARVLAHPRAVTHLVDPARLEAATMAVYGEAKYSRLYGKLVPIPAERIHATGDGERVPFAGRALEILHTPGHAMHHHVLFDPEAGALFSGDTFGLSYRALDTAAGPFIVPTTTPTQFDPAQLVDSVRRIVARAPASVYLTHFGRVTGVARLGAALEEQLARFVELARAHAAADDRQARIRAALARYLTSRAEAHGVADPAVAVEEVLGADLDLNAQGLVAWLGRVQKPR